MNPFDKQDQIRVGDRLEEMDKEIRAWARLTRKKLLFRLAALGLKDRERLASQDGPELYKSLRSSVRKRNLEIEKVGFSFARHGIFLERGVGKGRPVGSAAASQAAKPWIKPSIEPALETLAKALEQGYGDIILAELKIIIPGIIDTRTK